RELAPRLNDPQGADRQGTRVRARDRLEAALGGIAQLHHEVLAAHDLGRRSARPYARRPDVDRERYSVDARIVLDRGDDDQSGEPLWAQRRHGPRSLLSGEL